MRLKISKSKHAQSLYVIRSTYVNGKHSSKVVEKLGTYDELKKLHPDPIAWAKEYIQSLNEQEKAAKTAMLFFGSINPNHYPRSSPSDVGISLCNNCIISSGFPSAMRIHLPDDINFSLIWTPFFPRLIYSRVLYPSSKSQYIPVFPDAPRTTGLPAPPNLSGPGDSGTGIRLYTGPVISDWHGVGKPQ